jgi:hypothetical protein
MAKMLLATWAEKVAALLQFLVCALGCVNCKCAYTSAMALLFPIYCYHYFSETFQTCFKIFNYFTS